MSLKKWVTLLTAGAIAAGSVSINATVLQAKVGAADEDAIKIMCVGDSITDGFINGDNGYRKYLCHYLNQNGISYDMVGPKNSWSDTSTYDWNGETITYDPGHCGYSQYTIKSYGSRSGIYEVLFGGDNLMETYDPDMVLLQIGTNDLLDARLDKVSSQSDITGTTTALERLESLVDEILANMDSTDTLFLASVPDIDAEIRADWLGAYGWILGVDTSDTAALKAKVDECVDTYNAGVQALAAEKKIAGYSVEFCDIHSVVDVKEGLYDGVHPNEAGYAEMGQLWANTLSAYLGENPIVPTPGTTVTTTETTPAATTTATTTVSEGTETTTVTQTTTPSEPFVDSEGNLHLYDVLIGTEYDLSPYDNIVEISVVFDQADESIGGKFVLGDWNVSKDYSAADLTDNTLTVAVDDEYDKMTVYRWNGSANIKEVILRFASEETGTTPTTTIATTTTTEETTTAATTTTTATETTMHTTLVGDGDFVYQIKISSEPTKTEYVAGEDLDLSGLLVYAHYTNGSYVKEKYYDVDPSDYPDVFTIDASEFNSKKAGTYTITVHYGDQEAAFDVTVTEPSYVLGDVDGDGKVSVKDAVKLRKYLVGLVEKDDLLAECGDVIQDGKLNIFDAARLMQMLIEEN